MRFVALIAICSITTAAASERRVTTRDGNALTQKPPVTVPSAWADLLDPTTETFWMEGNHRPDAGLVLWARNPTKENAKLYLLRMAKKRDMLQVLQKQAAEANLELIRAGAIADDYGFLASAIGQGATSLQPALSDTHIYFFFTPTCPHCLRQAEVLRGLSNVSPLQVGGKALVNLPGLPASTWANEDDMKRYSPEHKLPVSVVYGMKTKKIAVLLGARSEESFTRAAGKVREKD